MSYRQYEPCPALKSYVDAYWTIKTAKVSPRINRILPDGCVDIIYNAGDDFVDLSEKRIMKNEGVYLVGTMTEYLDTMSQDFSNLIGIRFKPLGFASFFRTFSLHEVTNDRIDFECAQLPRLTELTDLSKGIVDDFLLRHLKYDFQEIRSMVLDIERSHGRITVHSLAKEHAMSSRQMERKFKQLIGLSPKEYINFIRYRSAYDAIQRQPSTSLSEIAFETGYFDHAHLTHEVKKYSGFLPSELQMSDFYKRDSTTRL